MMRISIPPVRQQLQIPRKSGPWQFLCLFACLLAPGATSAAEPVQAPYVDSQAIKERFDTVTPADMEMLRSKKILFASRSFGLNLCGGLAELAKKDKNFELVSSLQRYNVRVAGGDLNIIPADAFEKTHFVHFLADAYPLTKRVDQMDALLRNPPHNFGKVADIAIIFYHQSSPEVFEYYAAKMDALRADFPNIRFIYVTAGFMGPSKAAANENSHLFSEMVRKRYKGKVPLYDLGAILSDDFRVGHQYCPEYSKDPADVHPNLPAGTTMMAKGFLLLLRDTLRQAPVAAAPLPEITEKADAKVETLPADHPDASAARAILDANGLNKMTVESISVVANGRIVELFLQEGGITELPDAIGRLDALRKLHLYGDRKLSHPLLTKISPEIGRCSKLEELLLNNNDLETLPVEIASLRQIKSLSLGDNRLKSLPPEVIEWAMRFDPKGLAQQNEGGDWRSMIGGVSIPITVGGARGMILMPAGKKMKSPAPWVWYAPNGLQPVHAWLCKRLLDEGISIACVGVGESQGNPKGRAIFTAFYEKITTEHGLAKKAALFPQSRGGLMLYNWAAEHPECVAAIGGIYPVGDLRSYPKMEIASKAYGMTQDELQAQLAQHNPIDRLEPLAKAHIPIFHVHGDKDATVPLQANSAELARRYQALGGDARVMVIPGKGHEPAATGQAFFQCQELADFLIKQAKAATE